jgi:preprotein translocase subunit SecF
MEFFHEPKIDWMEIKWYFITLSLALALIGILSMVAHKGLVYGIDFRGGTLVDVKFSQPPNVDAIRHELDRAGLRNATIQGLGPASRRSSLASQTSMARGRRERRTSIMPARKPWPTT